MNITEIIYNYKMLYWQEGPAAAKKYLDGLWLGEGVAEAVAATCTPDMFEGRIK